MQGAGAFVQVNLPTRAVRPFGRGAVICQRSSGGAIWRDGSFGKPNMPRGATDNLPPTPAALRTQAARARRHARNLVGDEAEERLIKLADELEARAAEIEKPQEVISPSDPAS
jgi:hypothetical protein